MVEASMGPPKPAITTALGHTPVLPFTGAEEITVGAPAWHAAVPVVKLQTKLAAIALPNVSVAPVVIVAVYAVFKTRGPDGVKVAVSLAAAYVTTPSTGVGPGAVKVKVVVSIVDAFIALLKVMFTTVFWQEPAAALGGPSESTVGGVVEPGLGEVLHPALKMSSRDVTKQRLILILVVLLNLVVLLISALLGLSFPRMNVITSPSRLNCSRPSGARQQIAITEPSKVRKGSCAAPFAVGSFLRCLV